jgi:peptidoglycan/LPS O-acetylase OafA/YrhL
MTQRRPQLPALTSSRFFAALYVVLFHLQTCQLIAGPSWFRKFCSIGYTGVSFFFVLSGFILVYTYAGRDQSAREFWRARFARVYPAYAFSLLAIAFIYFPAVMSHDVGPVWAWSAAHLKLSSLLAATL